VVLGKFAKPVPEVLLDIDSFKTCWTTFM